MAAEPIKDAGGNVLGSIETAPDGSQVLRDANGRIRGYYDPSTDLPGVPTKGFSPKETCSGR